MESNSEIQAYQCNCNALTIEIVFPAAAIVICHCNTCRHLTNQSSYHQAVFPTDQVRITDGPLFIKFWQSTSEHGTLHVVSCKQCNTIMFHTNKFGLIGVGLDTINNKELQPTMHLNYQHRVDDQYHQDPLIKFIDFPQNIGGTGSVFTE
eukprot:TRINITY_DN11183_c0_g1_i1.p1 TRINITY_DN11183_c0_g1~~TRINITY_DN11183_c0_g1_i1.p1  ORF type:complete len:150 (+),score=7.22 TRINITY_DN11183_c0_g1_i1:15-464(+)